MHESEHAFVECATFADDYKYNGEGWQGDFHFKIQPYIAEGEESDYDIDDNYRNLTYALGDFAPWLSGKGTEDYKNNYMYAFLMDKFGNDEDVAKSYALRLVVHYIGDLVQPFHNENRYTSVYSEGDNGANKVPLPYHYEVDELHALWDKVLYD